MWGRINKGLWWDKAWSLVDGCTPVSEGCEHCWSKTMNDRFKKRDFSKVTPRWDRLEMPLKIRKPTVFAVWNDLFHEDAPGDFIRNAFQTMYKCPQHIFLILTKRPERALNILTSKAVIDNIKSHVWIGVTAENQEQADRRIPILIQIPVMKKFVSVEPMLGPIDLYTDKNNPLLKCKKCGDSGKLIDWVICGCETGQKRRYTDINWIRNLHDQCQAAGVPFFLKQMEIDGQVVKTPELDGRKWLEVPNV